MIEDEDSSKQLFARKRLTFDAVATVVERDSEMWQQVVGQMKDRFGEIIDGLSQLEDFVLFNLKAEQGLFVKVLVRLTKCLVMIWLILFTFKKVTRESKKRKLAS